MSKNVCWLKATQFLWVCYRRANGRTTDFYFKTFQLAFTALGFILAFKQTLLMLNLLPVLSPQLLSTPPPCPFSPDPWAHHLYLPEPLPSFIHVMSSSCLSLSPPQHVSHCHLFLVSWPMPTRIHTQTHTQAHTHAHTRAHAHAHTQR